MYKHYRVNRMRSKAKRVLADLFEIFLDEPQTLPPPWSGIAQPLQGAQRARIVCDYIAGMTDTFALEEHRRLFDSRSLA
jgi:dGTPase